jgi:hypothetical protein
MVILWTRAFQHEIDESADDTELRVDRGLAARQLWLWDRNGETVSMAVARASPQMEWSACRASIRPLKNGNMVTRRRGFTSFRDGRVRLGIAAFSTLSWQIPHQIPSTGELDIELSQKLSAIALSDAQAERVAAQADR